MTGYKELDKYCFINESSMERQLIRPESDQSDVPFVDLSKIPVDTELTAVLPKNLARKHGVVPICKEAGIVYLAMKDVRDFIALEEVKMAVRGKVIPVKAPANGIECRFQELYGGEGVMKAIEEMDQRKTKIHGESDRGAYLEMSGDESEAPAIRLVNSILERAVAERASDIHLEPREGALMVRMRIDGDLHEILEIPFHVQSSVISRVKIMAGMNITERRIPQDGHAAVRIQEQAIDLRISTLPVLYGEKVVIRLLNQNRNLLTRSGIGIAGRNQDRFDQLLSRTSGVILIAGPTGSGKTSTLYTMIQELNKEEINIVTLEDPVEYHIAGVNQVMIHEKTGMTFAGALRSVLRQDPDVIVAGEIRDGETARIAMSAALTGHLVLSTIHTDDALTGIDRLRDIGVPQYMVARAINGIVAQRLVKRICPECRRAYEPDEQEKRILGIETQENVIIYKGDGCPHCFNTGYRGRIGVFEIVRMDQKLRQAVLDGADRNVLTKIVKDSSFISMEEEVKRLVLEGVTTVEEATKILRAMWES